jgi:HAD superfamily hydrolase (TIGR01509 family)
MLFLFDMDNVLYDYQWRIRMDGLAELTGHDFHELRRRWWHDDGEWLAEKGIPSTGAEYLRLVNNALESNLSVDQWLFHRRAAMTPRPDIINVAKLASTLGDVAVLTNNGALIGEHLPNVAHELVDVFGHKLYSTAYFKARKPEPEVFHNALNYLGHTPEDTLFIDDMPDNIRGAQSMGITGEWFRPHHPAEELADTVRAFAKSR